MSKRFFAFKATESNTAPPFEPLFTRSALGQLVYDLLFTHLSERYLARKHRIPVARIRNMRIDAKRAFREGQQQARRRQGRRRR